MKHLITPLIGLLISSQASAGDMYLTCKNKSETFFKIEAIEIGKAASLQFDDKNFFDQKMSFEVTATMHKQGATYTITRTYLNIPAEYNYEPEVLTLKTNKWNEYFQVSQNVICSLKD